MERRTIITLAAAFIFALIATILGGVAFTKHEVDTFYDNLPDNSEVDKLSYIKDIKVAYIGGVIALSFGIIIMVAVGALAVFSKSLVGVERYAIILGVIALIFLILGAVALAFNGRIFDDMIEEAKKKTSSFHQYAL